ncbi:MAG: hypothetical protein A3B47_00335 [Candidatus Levybacteria bacterium RIFCSPLOWO2_01_FULL_39_24]|nr:MAG: hypothetical protein A2800_00855 [Candidatus Levybacteria bacterium RIFCSPHIGHO2_01_FULL_40_16]OGH46223.1 MAG: hypothetical protein A3B47_00335 [Candidatus Levybacteria bacterium RIFCSPLOWO2_01_FULL_39_24]
MKKTTFLIFLGFFALSVIFFYISFHQLKGNQFYFIGDQFLRFSYNETFINSFFIRRWGNLGVLNCWQLMIPFWDVIYYLIAYKLGASLFFVDRFYFFIVTPISLVASFIGFKKISELVIGKINLACVFVITLWYYINPYSVSLFHGGGYGFSVAFAYSFAPLIIYYFHEAIFTEFKINNAVICALLLFFASFTFWLSSPLVLTLILYTLIFTALNPKFIKRVLANGLRLLLIFLPLISVFLFTVLYEYFNHAGDNNATFMPTFGNEMGGIWYQLLMLFSWGIYNVWTPRAMYPFFSYYFSAPYIISTLAVYVIILIGLLRFCSPAYRLIKVFIYQMGKLLTLRKNKIKVQRISYQAKIIISVIGLFLISLFLAKGPQPPFGEVFLFLYNKVPFFSVFRTPDIRFGFIIVLMISIMLIFVSAWYKKTIFIPLIIIIMLVQSTNFFNGNVLRGENIKDLFYERILEIPREYTDVANYLNKQKEPFGYIFTLPSQAYGHFRLEKEIHHFGQDILQKLVNDPSLYLDMSDGTSNKAYTAVANVIKNKDFKSIAKFPIKYIIFRKDVVCDGCSDIAMKDLEKYFKLVFQNDLFYVYKVDSFRPIVDSSNITYRIINPTKIKVYFRNVKKIQDFSLMLSFNNDWKLYVTSYANKLICNDGKLYSHLDVQECFAGYKFFENEDLSYLWRKQIFQDSHELEGNYANKWLIDPATIKKGNPQMYSVNKDGSINFELIIYYQPQSWFYLTFLMSSFSLVVICIFLLLKHRRKYE